MYSKALEFGSSVHWPFMVYLHFFRDSEFAINTIFGVGAKQVSPASPTIDLRGNKGKAGETFALPLH